VYFFGQRLLIEGEHLYLALGCHWETQDQDPETKRQTDGFHGPISLRIGAVRENCRGMTMLQVTDMC
jgi:hypothetical protein